MTASVAVDSADTSSDRGLIWFYVGAFLGPFGSTIANVLIPTLTGEFGTDVQLVTFSISAYMYTFALCLLFSGAISDSIGARQAVTGGCLVFGVASLICGLAPSIEVFIAGRALQGVGNAFTTALLMASLGDLIPAHRLGKALGFFAAFQMAGGLFGPLISGALAAFEWRLSFFLTVGVSLFLAIYYWRYYSRLGVGLVGRGGANPLRVMAGLWNTRMGLLCAISFLGYLGAPSLAFLVAIDVETRFGVPPVISGLVLAGFGLVNVLGAPKSGTWVDRFGRYRMILVSLIALGSLTVVLAFLPWLVPLALLFAALGLPTVIMWTAIGTLAVEAFPKQRGAATSIFNAAKFAGWATSPVVLTPLYFGAGPVLPYLLAAFFSFVVILPVVFYRQQTAIPATA